MANNLSLLDRIMSAAEAAEKWDLAESTVRNMCKDGTVSAVLKGKTWIIDAGHPYPGKRKKPVQETPVVRSAGYDVLKKTLENSITLFAAATLGETVESLHAIALMAAAYQDESLYASAYSWRVYYSDLLDDEIRKQGDKNVPSATLKTDDKSIDCSAPYPSCRIPTEEENR